MLPRFSVQPLDVFFVRIPRIVEVQTVGITLVAVLVTAATVLRDRLVSPPAFPPSQSAATSLLRCRPFRIDMDHPTRQLFVTQRRVPFSRLEPLLQQPPRFVDRPRRQSLFEEVLALAAIGVRLEPRLVQPVFAPAVDRVAQTGSDSAIADEARSVSGTRRGLVRPVTESGTPQRRDRVQEEVFEAARGAGCQFRDATARCFW
jgi:hypothetical protein